MVCLSKTKNTCWSTWTVEDNLGKHGRGVCEGLGVGLGSRWGRFVKHTVICVSELRLTKGVGFLNKEERPVGLCALALSPSESFPAGLYLYFLGVKSIIQCSAVGSDTQAIIVYVSYSQVETLTTSQWAQIVGQSVYRRRHGPPSICTILETSYLKSWLMRIHHISGKQMFLSL